MPPTLTPTQHAHFETRGFLILRGLFSAEEIGQLSRTARADPALSSHVEFYRDRDGRESVAKFWETPPDDIYGRFMSCRRVVDTMETLLGGPLLHYHHKINMKKPVEGGAWEWHQDYGYWYTRGYAFPHMGACLIAIDPCTSENGCLEVLAGSHKLGRLDHEIINHQLIASPERLARLRPAFEQVACTLDPGDAVFFHCNLLHSSRANTSPSPRWVMVLTYNRADNPCLDPRYQSRCQPIEKVSDAALLG